MARELLLAALGVKKSKVPDVIVRSQAMSAGFAAHSADYSALSPALPAFEILIQNLVGAQQLVPAGTVGAAKARNVQLDLLWSAMKSECAYVQTLVDINPTRGLLLIQNAGLVGVTRLLYTKPLLALTLGTQPGTVNCNANVGLLVGAGTTIGAAGKTRPATKRGAATFLAAGRRFSGARQGLNQNIENNPMQSKKIKVRVELEVFKYLKNSEETSPRPISARP